jgi:hypothetical protein
MIFCRIIHMNNPNKSIRLHLIMSMLHQSIDCTWTTKLKEAYSKKTWLELDDIALQRANQKVAHLFSPESSSLRWRSWFHNGNTVCLMVFVVALVAQSSRI